MASVALAQEQIRIELPSPAEIAGADVLQALRARRSIREYAARPLPLDTLATLLWAAYGVNRPRSGGRTAPSAHGAKEIAVYVALSGGAYRYDPAAHALELVSAKDVRELTGEQDFVATAPLDLVYVADLARLGNPSAEERSFYVAADAGVIAQNVYLYCAASGLATVVRGLVDRRRLAPALGLRREQRIVLAQTVGYPAA